MNAVTEIPGDYQHVIELYDPFDLVKLSLVINGLNDDQNIFCEILPSVQESIVESFNNRNGAVVPADHDYSAEQIDYDNQASQLQATNVQAAIDEVHGEIPEHVVNSFNNREGNVTPENHDYNAEQIDYDNTTSQLQATDVQAAIDEIIGLVITAGVGSFNGRSGIVLPQSGDYPASLIPISTSNTDLPNTVTNVQQYIEYEHPAAVTVTLTINGAKEDSIIIYDSNDVQVGSCIFASGQTSGTCQISVPAGGGSYKFVSSVSKNTTDGTSDYEKTVALSDAINQTVNVYPDHALFWYGNYIVGFTRESIQPNLSKTDLTNALEIHWNTNSIGSGAYYTDNPIDLSTYSKVKMNCISVNGTIRWFGEIASPDANSNNFAAIDASNTTSGIKELDVSAVATTNYIGMLLGGDTDNTAYITISAFWLE